MKKNYLFTVLSAAILGQGCTTFENFGSSTSPNSIRPNAYGLGVNADQYGRPSTYQLQNGQQLDPIFNNGVKQNAYGPGVGQDQFGRPVSNSY